MHFGAEAPRGSVGHVVDPPGHPLGWSVSPLIGSLVEFEYVMPADSPEHRQRRVLPLAAIASQKRRATAS